MTGFNAKEKRMVKILSSPVLWGQHYLRNRDGSARAHWAHQAQDLECGDSNIILLDGRDVGK